MTKLTPAAKALMTAAACTLFAASLSANAADNFLADKHKAKAIA